MTVVIRGRNVSVRGNRREIADFACALVQSLEYSTEQPFVLLGASEDFCAFESFTVNAPRKPKRKP